MTAVEAAKATMRVPQPYPLSLETYHAMGEMGLLPEKTELLYGQVYQKMPESPLHSLLFMRLLGSLQRAAPAGTHVRPEKPLACGGSEPVPDLAVVPGSIEDYSANHPASAELVVEVCVSSHEHDRSKLPAYAAAGVKEVWLVLTPEQQIEVHRQPAGEQFRERMLHGPGGRLVSTAFPTLGVELEELFAGSAPIPSAGH